ncbi:MAG: hypothetical protein RL431_702 [Actinomycetota bacterium]
MTVVVVGRSRLAFTTECVTGIVAELRMALREITRAQAQSGGVYASAQYTAVWIIAGRLNAVATQLADAIAVLENMAMVMDSREFDRVAALRSTAVAIPAAWPVTLGTAVLAGTSREAITGLRHVSSVVMPLIPHTNSTPGAVVVTESSTTEVLPPRTVAERVARIPTGDERIRIEKYGSGATAEFEVYIAGTDAIVDPTKPFAMNSNLSLATSQQSDSLTAVTQALRRAGVGPENPILMTGHSQGGLVAVALANTDEWNVRGIVTAGTPLELLPAPRGIPMIHLEHLEDPVVALGGHPGQGRGETWLAPSPAGERLMGAHAAAGYVVTAREVDSHPSEFVDTVLRRWQGYGRGTATLYSAVNRTAPEGSG